MFLQLEQRRTATGEYSEETARIIDDEVRNIIDRQYTVAMKLLDEKRDILEEAVTELLEKEKIDGSYLEELIKEKGTEKPLEGV